MEEVLNQVLLLAPIFLLSPTVYAAILVVFSSGGHPVSRGTAILIGSAITVIIIGIILIAAGGTIITRPDEPSMLSGIINLILGVAFILLSLFVAFRKKADKEESGKNDKETPHEPSFRSDARLGFILTVTNPTSLASYVTVAKVSTDAAISVTQQAIAMVIAGILFVMPIVWPLLLTIAVPQKAEKFLSATNRGLNKYGKYFLALILIYVGYGLMTTGLNILK